MRTDYSALCMHRHSWICTHSTKKNPYTHFYLYVLAHTRVSNKFIDTTIHIHTHTCTHTQDHAHTCISSYSHFSDVHISKYSCMYANVCVRLYANMHARTLMRTKCIHTLIHAHTYTLLCVNVIVYFVCACLCVFYITKSIALFTLCDWLLCNFVITSTQQHLR